MKHRLSILLFAVVLATACTRESVDRGTGGKGGQIGFSTSLDVTRGIPVNSAAGLADNGGFSVWAYGHTDKWTTATDKSVLPGLDGAAVTSPNGSTWTYGTPVDWPIDRYVSFFAYGPAKSATVSMQSGEPVIDFTVAPTVANQKDLLVSGAVYDQLGVSYSYDKQVTLFFKHALSRVLFSARFMNEPDQGRKIKIKEIVLNGLHNSGTTTFDQIAWTLGSSKASYTASIANGALKNEEVGDLDAEGNAAIITSDNGYMFLMPQTLARETDDPTMEVVMEVTADGQPAETRHETLVFSPDTWLPGKSYNYQIVIDGDDVKLILIDADLKLDDWNVSLMVQPIALTEPANVPVPDYNVALTEDEKNDIEERINNDPVNQGKSEEEIAELIEAAENALLDIKINAKLTQAEIDDIVDTVTATNSEASPEELAVLIRAAKLALVEQKAADAQAAYEAAVAAALKAAEEKDEARIHSALNAFAQLNEDYQTTNAEGLPDNTTKYYAIYLRLAVAHDITIDMADYDDKFFATQQIIFDASKLITDWGGATVDDSSGSTVVTDLFTFTLKYNPAKWVLSASRQPFDPDDLDDDPDNPTHLDAVTSATTLMPTGDDESHKVGSDKRNKNRPSKYIRNRGSIILERLP